MTSTGAGRAEALYSLSEREQQRVTYLVLGHARPTEKVTMGKRSGRRKPIVRAVPVALDATIEPHMQRRERWSHKRHATPETLEHAYWEDAAEWHSPMREGSLARLYRSGTLDADQLAAAEQIAAAFTAIGRDVSVATASYETRIDTRRGPGDRVFEKIEAVWRELAYTRWRAAVGPFAPAMLDMIVNDVGLTLAAQRHHMHKRRVRQALIDALDLWPRLCSGVRRDVDEAMLIDCHAGMMG